MLIVRNAKIMSVIVKPVFMDMPYISLNKFVKFQQFLIANQLSMAAATIVMMVTKWTLILLAMLIAKYQTVKFVRIPNLAQVANLDSILCIRMVHWIAFKINASWKIVILVIRKASAWLVLEAINWLKKLV